MNLKNSTSMLSRRKMLKATGLAGAAALVGCALAGCDSKADSKGVTTGGGGDGPETPNLNFGMIALTDCSPIVIAHEKGFFKKYGINSKVTKGASWAAIRDALSNGDIEARRMGTGLQLTSTRAALDGTD